MAGQKKDASEAVEYEDNSASAVCDNHPDREAVFSTDGGGAFQTIRFCQECIPTHWR